MIALSKVLIVDDSKARELLRIVFEPHCRELLVVSSCSEAKRRIDENRDISVVLVDEELAEGGGTELLRYVASCKDARPPVIVLAERPSAEEAMRAAELGANGYLAKPTSFRDVCRVLRRHAVAADTALRVRRRSLGRVFLAEPSSGLDPRREELAQLAWEIRDLCVSGAFVETSEPIPVGEQLELGLLFFGKAMVRVRVEVVRLQQPTWGRVGGVGIAFKQFAEGSKELLESFVAQAEGDVY